MGAAGDMLMAALLELHDNPSDFVNRLNAVGVPGVQVSAEPATKCGITGTHIAVKIGDHQEGEHHDHHHANPQDSHGRRIDHIENLIDTLALATEVKANALSVYRLIAEAESQIHGVPVSQIHFHEVGELDAITDIVGVCMLVAELAPDQIIASAVNVGSGHVHCAHGVLPVPAPATANLLRTVPIYDDGVVGEICTPTGAALLKFFASDFQKMPLMRVSKIGYGMGMKDFERANCLRAYLGETEHKSEEIVELVCNLDDMTPEAVAFAQQLLFDEGALDVYTTTLGMKKGRVGVGFTCMCRKADKDKMLELIFKHTSTLGVREYSSRRYALRKQYSAIETALGTVQVKTSSGFGIQKSKPEYEDLARIARENQMSLAEALELLK